MSQKEINEKPQYKTKKEIKEENKEKNKNIRTAAIRGFIIGLLCIMTTYAWFTSQKDITVSNLSGTVEVVENMEISLDAKSWSHLIDLSEMVGDESALQAAVSSRNAATDNTAPNIEPNELLPVSTIGGIGSTYMPMYKGESSKRLKVTKIKSIRECQERNGNEGIDNGYFAFDIYIKNMAREDDPDILQLNLNSAAQVLTEEIEKQVIENGVPSTRKYIGKSYSGIQNTIRVALALYEDTAEVMASQKEILDITKNSTISKVTIWEPNAPYHVDYIVDNNNILSGSGAVTFENGDAVPTYALTADATNPPAEIADVYNTDSAGLAIQKTVQTEIASTEEGNEDYRILGIDNKPINLVDTTGKDFTIAANKISRLRMYVWIEGQDIDCINLASEGGGIEVDLGLTKDFAIGNVLNRTEGGNNQEPDQGNQGEEPDNQGAEGGENT